jgi:hypothetical protein
LAIFEVSIVQYNVSVKVVGVVFDHESVRMLLGNWLGVYGQHLHRTGNQWERKG